MANFKLEDYEPVEERIKKYARDYPDYRVETKVLKYTENHILIKAVLYKNRDDQMAKAFHSTGIAEEVRGEGFVNKTSHVENCETSAIGRALANANYSGDKRPSREEMAKVKRLSSDSDASQTAPSDEDSQICPEHKCKVPKRIGKTGKPYWGCLAGGKMHFLNNPNQDEPEGYDSNFINDKDIAY